MTVVGGCERLSTVQHSERGRRTRAQRRALSYCTVYVERTRLNAWRRGQEVDLGITQNISRSS